MKYYRVNLGYSEFVSIDETELEKAMTAQLTNAIVVFKNGTVNGKYISHIVPDYRKELGLYPNTQLDHLDYDNISRIEKKYIIEMEKIRDRLNTSTNFNPKMLE